MADNLRLDAYLARIGVQPPLAPDLDTLKRLHAAHAEKIPFEGMDPLLGRPVKLDLDALQAKLLDGRRGGYCYEQNLLFKAALETLGFAVTLLGARVRWTLPPEAPLGPRVHAVLRVDLPEGQFIADVGFGACVLDAPLALSMDIEQKTAMGVYRLSRRDGHVWLAARRAGGWRAMYAFDRVPQLLADYELGSFYASTSPRAPFTSVLILEKVGRDQRMKLVNTKLIVEARDGELVEERRLETPEALGAALDAIFDVVPPAPLETLFARASAPPA